jgi:rhodanese-related sulfurtransferase
MAAMLYESLHQKLMTLDDDVQVYPAHGAGSMCGRNISKETSSTIGEQKRFNYALQPMSREAFVRMMTTDLPEAPSYFPRDAEVNRTGAAALGELPRAVELSPAEVDQLSRAGHLILDLRPAAAYGNGHVPAAINIGLGGQFASWAGTLIAHETPIVLVADDDAAVDEAVTRLARVGIESVKGFLGGGMYAWDQAGLTTATTPQMPVDELRLCIQENSGLQILDVRRPAEHKAGHVPGAINIPLAHLEQDIGRLDSTRPTAVICASGYRSSAATCILERHAVGQIFNVVGGTNGWINAGYPVESAS